MRYFNLAFLLLAVLLILVACGRQDAQEAQTDAENTARVPVITETWQSARHEADNVDSPAAWHGNDGQHWVIATCKSTDQLLVLDATSGSTLQRVGSAGDGPGQFRRPNGVAVVDDLCIVVERDNHRVQVLRLPQWETVATFGADVLIKPYGVALRRTAEGYLLYVTDNYETADEQVPADSLLGARVKMFALITDGESVQAEYRGAFGATHGDGTLHVVESIAVDTAHARLLIADEDARYNDIKIYDLDGRYQASIMGNGGYRYQPEGIVLCATSADEGYWFTTDQDEADNTFIILDRRTLDPVGSFKAAATTNTDGIALTRTAMPGFPSGAFIAVHNDGNVAAIDLQRIADSLRLTL
jgi:3-phytase